MSKTMIGTVSGLTTARWGTDGAGTTTLGIVTSARRRKNSKKGYVPNTDGETQAEVHFDQSDEVSCEVIALDAAALPATGDQFTMAGVTGVVQDCEEAWRTDGFVVFNINVTKFQAMTLA